MPAIDGLLRLIEAQKAEGLVLNTHKPPALLQAGRPHLLSMPPLTPSLIDTIVDEVLSREERTALQLGGVVETVYQSDKGGWFAVRVRVSTDKLVLTFRPSVQRGHGPARAEGAQAEGIRLPPSEERKAGESSGEQSITAAPASPEAKLEAPSEVAASRPPVVEIPPPARRASTRSSGEGRTGARSSAAARAADPAGSGATLAPVTERSAAPERAPSVERLPILEKGARGEPRPAAPVEALLELLDADAGQDAVGREHAIGRAPAGRSEVLPLFAGDRSVLVQGMLERSLELGASDILFTVGAELAIRTGAEWTGLGEGPGDEQGLLDLLGPFIKEHHSQELSRSGHADLSCKLELQGGIRRFRVNLFRQLGGLAAAFRPIPETIPTLAQLSLPEQLKRILEYPSGLVLITGPAGSGKSTTLAALVDQLNRVRARHILTLEDPIEFVYPARKGVVHQREVGTHVESFSAGLRAALREAPDIILLGEMRDFATISAAITAAETGHLVVSTLHTANTSMAIDRLVDVFPEQQQGQVRAQLAGVLRAVVTQHLLPGLRSGQRFPALEILLVNYAVASLIREKRIYQIPSQIQIGREEGMLSLEHSLVELVRTGRISRETAARASADIHQQRELLRER